MDQKIAGRVEGEQFFLPAGGGQDAACGVVVVAALKLALAHQIKFVVANGDPGPGRIYQFQ